MNDHRYRMWHLFILGRAVFSGAFLVVLFMVNGLVPPERLRPIYILGLLQFLATLSYLYFLKRGVVSLLALVSFSLEIVLITLLILTFGQDGYAFLLAYLWPLIMAGWFVGQKAVLPLALLSTVAYSTLLVLRQRGIAYTDRIFMPDGITPQALILAVLYLGFSSLLFWALAAEKERGEKALAEHSRRLHALVEASNAMLLHQEIPALMHIICEQARRITHAAYAEIDWGSQVPPMSGLDSKGTDAPSRRVHLNVPLVGTQGVKGALRLMWEGPLPSMDESMEHILGILGHQAGVSLENAELVERLRHERESLAAILRNMSEGVFVVDADMNVLLANQAAEDLLGIRQGEKVPRELQVTLQAYPEVQQAFGEVRMSWNDRIIRLTSSPLPSTSSQPASRLYVAQDFTREAQIEQMKTDFVAYASHELRAPLTTVKMLVELLRSYEKKDAKQNEYLAIMDEQLERQARLINNLLDLTRLENGTFDLTPEWVDVGRILDSVLSAFAPLCHSKRISLHYDCAVEQPIYSNALGIEQIVSNLLSNAIKFTPPDGEITLLCYPKGDDQIAIAVRDTGTGIAPEDLPHIFTKFYKGRSKEGGTGLGLAIAKMIAEALGGDISVESTVGQGATFTLHLPCSVPQQASR